MDNERQRDTRARIAKLFEGVQPYSPEDLEKASQLRFGCDGAKPFSEGGECIRDHLLELKRLIEGVVENSVQMVSMSPEEQERFPMRGYDFIIGPFGIKRLDRK